MDVKEFRFLKTSDPSNTKYEAWSRVYEYIYILNKLKELGANAESRIHNTSWGFEGCHVVFKNDLDASFNNVMHSDMRASNLPKTMVYDITKPAAPEFKNYYDFVINISTIEEVPYDNMQIIRNLYDQVKVGGYLIITFDYWPQVAHSEGCGSMNLEAVAALVGQKPTDMNDSNNIHGSNSISPCERWSHLRCGVLVIQKTGPKKDEFIFYFAK